MLKMYGESLTKLSSPYNLSLVGRTVALTLEVVAAGASGAKRIAYSASPICVLCCLGCCG